jgi:hypothetical protein
MKSRPPRGRQSLADSLFGLGWHSGAPEGFAAPGAAHFGPGNTSAHPLDNHAALDVTEILILPFWM